MKRAVVTIALVACTLALAVVGCRTPRARMGRYDVKITLSQSMTDSTGMLPSVEVHILALGVVRGQGLESQSMTDYWNPNRPKDDYVKHTMHFGEGHPHSRILRRTDPIWSEWDRAGASWLFVLADLPGVYEDKKDVKDPRRMILPLDPRNWRYKGIDIMIEPGGIYNLTPRGRTAKKEKKD